MLVTSLTPSLVYGIDLHRYRLLLVPWSEANALTSGLDDNIRYKSWSSVLISISLSLLVLSSSNTLSLVSSTGS